jgi:predicted NBD/HSP70 family sugar kinase
MPNYSIGVDLGRTNLRIAAVGWQGNLLEKITLGTPMALGRDRVVRDTLMRCDASPDWASERPRVR